MSFLNQALKLASQGFYVFPLQPNGKLPQIDDFPNRATKDPEQIKKWWTCPVTGWEQPCNVGISTTKYNGTQALIVVDVDNKNGKDGNGELLKLELAGFDFIETMSQKTPTGGHHLIYRNQFPVTQGSDVLATGLDIRARGGYIVGPGSVINDVPYELENDLQVNECPQWIVQACGKAPEKDLTPIASNVDENSAALRAKYYLENEAPLALEGQGGDQTTFTVAARLKDFGVQPGIALELLLEYWNERCEPPWTPEDLKKKIHNAYSYSQEPIGSKSPEAVFEVIKDEPSGSYLDQLNREFALIFEEDSHAILQETVDEQGRPKRKFLKEATFKRMLSPKVVQQGKGKALCQADIWLDWEKRREYKGLSFCPEQAPQNGYYNLWRGFAYKPKPFADSTPSARLGFEMFIDHAKTNVCGGDENLFLWLMGYFAHMIQKPYERPLTTLVFRGRKGVGKNVLIDRVGKLLGSGHYLVAHDSRYLTSNFNGHLDSCLCLVLDEAFWSGDKTAEGKLKGITTAPEIMIERKNKEPYTVKNLVRLIVVGNEKWLVPASYDERRYAVFDVGEGRKQQGKYFEQMRILLDHKGGAEILMDYFKNFDLSKVDVNVAPATKGLHEQKLDSLSLLEQFWHACLINGKIVNTDFSNDWPNQIEKSDFRRAYTNYARERNSRSWVQSDESIGRELCTIAPSISPHRKMKIEAGKYAWAYTFSDLETARAEWDERFGIKSVWTEII